ncbi:hypothetical protein [Bradyrhizobium sp. AZCC 1578]|uniref:hypothetical protein n=1 Tax=Bradyrhizobium sp. AZCC 1578 TaxID=3117027 RepID=UPI002FEF785E
MPKAKSADHAIQTLIVTPKAAAMKIHPLLDPLQAQAPKARLPKEFAPGMERRNLEKVVDARGWFLADEPRVVTANQYGCNSLRQIAIDMLLERDGFYHDRFHVEYLPMRLRMNLSAPQAHAISACLS